MTSVPSPVRPRKPERQPLPPVSVVGRFIGGATAHDLLIGAAVLEIEDVNEMQSYWCQVATDRGAVSGYSVRRFGGGEVYDLPADLSSCDCPDRNFRPDRPAGCRHMVALRQALATAAEDVPAECRPDRKTERDDLTGPGPDLEALARGDWLDE